MDNLTPLFKKVCSNCGRPRGFITFVKGAGIFWCEDCEEDDRAGIKNEKAA